MEIPSQFPLESHFCFLRPLHLFFARKMNIPPFKMISIERWLNSSRFYSLCKFVQNCYKMIWFVQSTWDFNVNGAHGKSILHDYFVALSFGKITGRKLGLFLYTESYNRIDSLWQKFKMNNQLALEVKIDSTICITIQYYNNQRNTSVSSSQRWSNSKRKLISGNWKLHWALFAQIVFWEMIRSSFRVSLCWRDDFPDGGHGGGCAATNYSAARRNQEKVELS